MMYNNYDVQYAIRRVSQVYKQATMSMFMSTISDMDTSQSQEGILNGEHQAWHASCCTLLKHVLWSIPRQHESCVHYCYLVLQHATWSAPLHTVACDMVCNMAACTMLCPTVALQSWRHVCTTHHYGMHHVCTTAACTIVCTKPGMCHHVHHCSIQSYTIVCT
jgi:hypothetical protein